MTNKIIAIDAGHGMKTAGKRCLKSIDPAQTREWFLNDRIADLVESDLKKNYDCTVLRVDDTTGAKDISLAARVKAANGAKADYYASIHHNAGIKGLSGGGTSVFCWSDSAMQAAARRLYDAVIARTGLVGNRSSKVVVSPLYVIKHTTMPALLLENGFMDSTHDTPIILTEAHAQKTARGIVDFLVAELGLVKKLTAGAVEDVTDKVVHLKTYYPAYTGKKTTLAPALASIGVNCSYSFRTKIAKANNITGYVGTATQNTRMYNLLVAGLLKRA